MAFRAGCLLPWVRVVIGVQMSDEPVIDWGTAPAKLREAHRAAKAEARAVTEERDAARREIAFLRAIGASALDSTTGRMFERGYDGEVSVEAIARAWGEVQVEAMTAAVRANNGDPRILLGDLP